MWNRYLGRQKRDVLREEDRHGMSKLHETSKRHIQLQNRRARPKGIDMAAIQKGVNSEDVCIFLTLNIKFEAPCLST